MDHPIFHEPNTVDLSFEVQPTPSSYARYPDGRDLPDAMPMWRVQTEGYRTNPDQPIGVVSRDAGFFDSPDVEWISGGVNSKGPNAVALGRHGNFFHWGFAASPEYLTDEAKLVFVNAVHYIAQFDGQTPVARKVQGTVVRSTLEEVLKGLTDEGYAEVEARYEAIRAEAAARKRELRERADAGEELSDVDRQILANDRTIPTPGRLDRVRRYFGDEVFERCGDDPAKVREYLSSHLGYVRPSGGWYELEVDMQLAAFGVANDDPAMLTMMITALASTTDASRHASAILRRYTNESFETQDEWKAWYEDVQDDLFFSETAGYKWLVNRRERAAPAVPTPTPTARDPLAAVASARALGDGTFEVSVDVSILKGWHAYLDVTADAPYNALRVELADADDWTPVGDWSRPPAHPDLDAPGVTLLEGRFAVKRKFRGEPEDLADLECVVSFQVCDDRMCLPPKRLTLEVTDATSR